MKTITVDWLSSSKFGSARLTSHNPLITAENEHGVDYRGFTDSPADLAEEMCLTSATTRKQAPARRQCTWVFGVMNHLNTTTPQDESPRLLCACG